jgi:hypothetical protein
MTDRQLWLEVYRLHVRQGYPASMATKYADEAVKQAPPASPPRRPAGLESGAALRGSVF